MCDAANEEIGIRMALGARRGEVLGLVMRQAALLIIVGITMGLLGATWSTRAGDDAIRLNALDGATGRCCAHIRDCCHSRILRTSTTRDARRSTCGASLRVMLAYPFPPALIREPPVVVKLARHDLR